MTGDRIGSHGAEVDALMEMGAAMLRASKPYQEFTASVGGAVRPDAGAEDWAGQARARRACARVDSDRGLPPVRFGNGG